MARSIANQLRGMDTVIDKIIADVLLEYAKGIMESIPANLYTFYRLEVGHRSVTIWTDNVFAAYIEFGTGTSETVIGGRSAQEYLASQPQEVRDEASPFFITGRGTIPAEPYLFPAYYKVKDKIPEEIDRRIQKYFNSIR